MSIELCWKLNPIIIHVIRVLGNAISKSLTTPLLIPDLNYEAQCQRTAITERQIWKITPLALELGLAGK